MFKPKPVGDLTDLQAAAAEMTVFHAADLNGHPSTGQSQAGRAPADIHDLLESFSTDDELAFDVEELVKATPPLLGAQHGLAKGLRMFAADFGRGKVSAANGEMDKATQQLTDETALRKIQVSAKKIDDMCGS